ncbi:MAG TPA: hypothetical protein VF276_17405 [Chloroflexia bacterium]
MYQDYINQARAAQHRQDLLTEAANERSLRAVRQMRQEAQQSEPPRTPKPQTPRRLGLHPAR